MTIDRDARARASSGRGGVGASNVANGRSTAWFPGRSRSSMSLMSRSGTSAVAPATMVRMSVMRSSLPSDVDVIALVP